jgi:hypothetical protein
MRMSRVLLAGVAVAAAAVGTTAFTAGNTLDPSQAGYGESTVTGAAVTNIVYTPWAADNAKLDSVVFTTSTDVTGLTATMLLREADSDIVGTNPYTCSITGTAPAPMTITCNTTDHPDIDSFETVGLTVVQ